MIIQLQDVADLCLWLDELLLLHDVHAGDPRPPHVDSDRPDQGGAGEVLDLLGHCGGEEDNLRLPEIMATLTGSAMTMLSHPSSLH